MPDAREQLLRDSLGGFVVSGPNGDSVSRAEDRLRLLTETVFAMTDAQLVTKAFPLKGTFGVSGTGPGTDTTPHSIPLVLLIADDHDVPSQTTKLVVVVTWVRNATAPAVNLTFGLYPVTAAGGADSVVLTLGTLVPGSEAAISAPPASSISRAASADFDFPTDGAYILGNVNTVTAAADSRGFVRVSLYVHNV